MFRPFMAEVTVTSVRVKVIGGPQFSGELCHTGRQVFRRAARSEQLEFSSQPLTVGLQKSQTPLPVSLGGASGNYIGVSPFAAWILCYEATMWLC
jgi:hypothetical protein